MEVFVFFLFGIQLKCSLGCLLNLNYISVIFKEKGIEKAISYHFCKITKIT